MTPRRTLTTLLLALGLTIGTQTVLETEAHAGPFDVLSQASKGGKRTHKRSKSSKSSKKSSDDKKRSSRSSSRSSSSSRRAVRTRTTRSSDRTVKNRRPRRTTTTRRRSTTHRPSSTRTRTVKNRRPRTTTTRRTTTHRSPRRTTTRRTTRRTTTRRTSHGHRTVRRSSHHHHRSRPQTRRTTHRTTTHRSSNAVRHDANADANAVEGYFTGGLGLSGFASPEITDLALPGAGYNLALGAKSGILGAELGINGGGYTFDPSAGTTDLAMVGLSGDLRLQPAIGFFEPFVFAGLGGYALQDAVIDEQATGIGLRLGGGADFRFRNFAFRLHYTHANYGMGDRNGGFDGSLSARTETLGGNLVWYF